MLIILPGILKKNADAANDTDAPAKNINVHTLFISSLGAAVLLSQVYIFVGVLWCHVFS
jgi:hypothetical protein